MESDLDLIYDNEFNIQGAKSIQIQKMINDLFAGRNAALLITSKNNLDFGEFNAAEINPIIIGIQKNQITFRIYRPLSTGSRASEPDENPEYLDFNFPNDNNGNRG
jgi:hypothetical protein